MILQNIQIFYHKAEGEKRCFYISPGDFSKILHAGRVKYNKLSMSNRAEKAVGLTEHAKTC
jgi:hypothetical protein